MSKNVMIPLSLLERIIELLDCWDVSGCDCQVRCDYHNVLGELIWKKKKLELRDAYAKIIHTDDENARNLARIEYLRQKSILRNMEEDIPF